MGGALGLGVVFAKHPAAAGQGVLVQFAGRLMFPQTCQVVGDAIRRGQGGRVVLAQKPAPASQGVLIQAPRLLAWARVAAACSGLSRSRSIAWVRRCICIVSWLARARAVRLSAATGRRQASLSAAAEASGSGSSPAAFVKRASGTGSGARKAPISASAAAAG